MTEAARKKKLIEVALPLDEINAACKADKDRKTGTLRNIHKWFAPMPLPAWRALLFAALVDDPENDNQRVALLDLIKRLVENGADLPDPEVLDEAKAILSKQFPLGNPIVMDPFCGGGSTLVEAQRLGLSAWGSDLNPVPALISRTLAELLPRLSSIEPLHAREADSGSLFTATDSSRAAPFAGLIQDVEHYAARIIDEAKSRLESYYPSEPGTKPIAWLWARTAPCPNPACGIETVLATSWWVNQKRGALAWLEPSVVDGRVVLDMVTSATGTAPDSPKVGTGVFSCVSCEATLSGPYLRSIGKAGRLGLRMTARAVEGVDGRRYLAPSDDDIAAAEVGGELEDSWPPLVGRATTNLALYGFDTWDQIFTRRQIRTLSTFAELISEVQAVVISDGGSEERGRAISTILGLALGQMARSSSTQSLWRMRPTSHAKAEAAYGRNDLPMMWDFAETYFDGGSVGDWTGTINSVTRGIRFAVGNAEGEVARHDARTVRGPRPGLVATDPPYFDAIGYADLSDFFYVWHRRALKTVHPDLYDTLATPKSGELTAIPVHHGGDKDAARAYFIEGFEETFRNLKASMSPGLPMLVVYASKEQKAGRGEEIRWSAILSAMVAADLEITGTWPVHGTSVAKMNSVGANVVSAYIVMVCRPRPEGAQTCSVADFNRALRRELSSAVRDLQAASILPVDLAQAAMGPGMQIYSRYRAVLDSSGSQLEVGQALGLINSALAEILDEQEGELDAESRFAVRWWESHGWNAAPFGEADKAARPLGIGVDDVVRAQVAISQASKVQLLGAGNLDRSWTPTSDVTPTAWEAVHHLADRLIDGGGELEAARLMAQLGKLQDPAMALTYRLHDIAAKKDRAADQERYNALINSWSELIRLSGDGRITAEGLF